MTLFIGPVGKTGGPAIKNEITLRYLFGSEIPNIVNTLSRSAVNQVLSAMRFALSREQQAIIAVSSGGRKVLLPMALKKADRYTDFCYSVICIGGTVAEEAWDDLKCAESLRRASLVAVETQGVANKLKALGVDNIHVMPNFVEDIHAMHPRVSFDETTMRFVFLSSVRNKKGISTMIDAFRVALSEGANALLDIYGPIRPDFDEALLDGLNDAETPIRYRGPVSHDDVSDVLRGYHCFIFPSEYETEGFPAVVAEAMACGLPIIASDIAYNSEIVRDGTNGIVFPAGDVQALSDAVVRISRNRGFAQKVSDNNVSDASRYDAGTVVGLYADALRDRGWTL